MHTNHTRMADLNKPESQLTHQCDAVIDRDEDDLRSTWSSHDYALDLLVLRFQATAKTKPAAQTLSKYRSSPLPTSTLSQGQSCFQWDNNLQEVGHKVSSDSLTRGILSSEPRRSSCLTSASVPCRQLLSALRQRKTGASPHCGSILKHTSSTLPSWHCRDILVLLVVLTEEERASSSLTLNVLSSQAQWQAAQTGRSKTDTHVHRASSSDKSR